MQTSSLCSTTCFESILQPVFLVRRLVFNYSVPHMLAVWNVKTGYFFACTAAIGFAVLYFILPEVSAEPSTSRGGVAIHSLTFGAIPHRPKDERTRNSMNCSWLGFRRGSSRNSGLRSMRHEKPKCKERGEARAQHICHIRSTSIMAWSVVGRLRL